DPNTGFAVYDSLSYQGESGWQEVGGTSAGTPQWGALVAIANQARVSAGGSGTLDGATGTLPDIYSLYSNSTNYADSFNDVTGGGAGGFGGGRGFGFRRFFGELRGSAATAGYDTVTGLGTPQAAAVIQSLVGATSTASAAVKTKVATAAVKAKAAIALPTVE